MDFKIANEVLLKNTDKYRLDRAKDYYKQGYIEESSYFKEDGKISFYGNIASKYQREVYDSFLIIDIDNKNIISCGCTCEDFNKNTTLDNEFICKHIAAITLKGIDELKSSIIDNLKLKTLDVKEKTKPKFNTSFINKDLLNYFKPIPKEKVNLEVDITSYLNDTLEVEFKIGNYKMYTIKDFRQFANSRVEGKSIVYGRNFIYDPKSSYFEDDEKLAKFIEDYGLSLVDNINARKNRYMILNSSLLRRLMKCLIYKEFTFNFDRKTYKPQIIEGDIPLNLDIRKEENKIIISNKEDLPIPLSNKGDVVFYKENIYILSDINGVYYKKLYEILNEYKSIEFEKEEISECLTNLIPKIKDISSNVNIDESIINNIIKDLIVKYYFDLEDSKIVCDVKLYYEGEDEGKFVIRDVEKEEDAIYRLYTNYFEKDKDKYVFRGGDNQLYDFLSKEINRLKNIGEVYYSDKFKEKKVYNASNIKVGLGEEINHYLEFKFKIEEVDKIEYKEILKAFKANKRFYKLKNGNFINLEEDETKEIFKLMETLGFTSSIKEMQIHQSKAMYINELLTENKIPYIEGIENTKKILDKFNNIDSLNYEIPKNLKANLRDYQQEGFNWFKTLDYCGFGGILADEMGLGKTLQTITFLLSKNNSKSIVVTPTSLIHNWKSEFEKFAPSLKIGIAHGSKKERELIIDKVENFDVILTTYGSLRNDFNKYEEINFDYMVIDEAQNIKNPTSITTDSVKGIKSKCKFALTGTPIENNLLELWSIFDFIMPGYLYNVTKFNAIFIRDENNIKRLKKLIKPFILRRTKKQVIKELPDKIEKKFLVELSKEQRKIYKTYVDEIQRKLQDKYESNDKITVLSYLTKLRQLCLDPSIIVTDYKGKSSKINACIELLKDGIENNDKVLVFSQFTSVLQNIASKLDKEKIEYNYLDGQTTAKDRIKLVNEFNENNNKKVFLISLKAGGTGLNLTSANTVIHFDPWWNISVENQASDRAHRLGQKQVVEVIKLIAKGTIEEKIIKLQEEKIKLIDDIISNELSDSATLKSLSNDEILDLLK
ncbi:DEAD/DEAH box helicase [[Clostridium] sordellii]|uniref:DEAD-like helicase n=1 Tax=Paraclostridium sordellii TaxID=1505 RepID=A0ABP1XSH9_PARSO|nr:DEAD/DEAH box helicase [Paeniclostridium sordellii]CEJ74124.1 putative DEAD-like helicase [[Clostridium] sordellii] [Paeniclostridium sordellii]CEN69669.1 DEAD/DEAH box helicase [[Clostridium] sordellii] [Paeniclostridium sordellii]CEN72937.1 DEAD/DEAH box helicase [[Clostridium] sordellii] [Paeniclostridium sordellii]CEO25303.1 DEAD/DEAH box helicase [[Clostridium] sordellii] [Paeniclostridium sordellii]CEP75470.1 DEAD/DEAH box helicase [[Clostridium] sordellii] [Paeniclostridium sordellii